MKFIDLFAGIGGFHLGMEQAGHECVGWVEWDKFARKSYQAIHDVKGVWNASDIRTVRSTEIPRADCWCFGFPCQDISVAGKQKGFTAGKRSSLFFTVTGLIRDLEEKDRPSYLLIENVKNLLSINGGFDFLKLQIELDEIGYDVEWDVLDSAQVVPQHRERVFIVGHLRGRSTRKIFPIIKGNREVNRRSDAANTLTTRYGEAQGSGSYVAESEPPKVKQAGNLMNTKYFGGNPQPGRVYDPEGISPTLSTMQGGGQEPKIMLEDKGDFIKHGTKILSQLWEKVKTENYAEWSERVSKLVSTTEILRQIMYEQLLSQDSSKIRKCELVCSPQESQKNRYGYSLQNLWSNQEYRHPSYRWKYSEQFTREFNCFVQKLPHETAQKRAYMQNLRETSERAPALQQALHQMEKIWESFVSQNQGKWRIRKITPLEAWRLQGFPDWAFCRAREAGLSDSQLYKQAGNSVTVPVVRLIAERMALIDETRR
ncbi:DNA (cytosine-5-)-methyltransferase [Levilactobacillus brevis]|uniref:DNA (cytosine-5-)-methyltransferase n=1 Tax=Levilactobacillus brevis TaxID=1580 RepID=UPI0019402DED